MADDEVNNEADGENTSARGPLSILLPPDNAVWREARRLATDVNTRVENLATAAIQDPIIVMELLRTANALYFSAGRSPITSPKTAIVRLGSDLVLEALDKLSERHEYENEDIAKWYSVHRSRSKRTGIVARLLSEAVARQLSEDAQAAGCLIGVGEMLAVAHLQEEYVALAEEHSRNAVNYRLAQNFGFDVEKMGLNYLRRYGIPEALLFGIDREARSRAPDRVALKPICLGAAELVDAFDMNRWEKLAPGKNLPPKSSLRMLQLSDSQYLKVYERTSEYLFSARMLEERQKEQPQEEEPESSGDSGSSAHEVLESEIQNILQGNVAQPAGEESTQEAPVQQATVVTEIDESLEEYEEQFSLQSAKGQKKTKARASEPIQVIEPPKLRTTGGNKFIDSMSDMFSEADNSEDLLASLLQMLVDGPFEKSALIVVSKSRTNAIVVAARGPKIGNGQKIELKDPLSPLAQCFSKVVSFSNKPNEASPFGCTSFALAPIDADHDTPVALYADCGNDGALTFEARRVFRTVVEILNQKLPSIPGGIPVELGE